MALHNNVFMTCIYDIDDGTPDSMKSLFYLAKLFIQA